MKTKCDLCDGRGTIADYVICGHNERCLETVKCYRCRGCGYIDRQAEMRKELLALEAYVGTCEACVTASKKDLSDAKKRLSAFRKKNRGVV